MLRILTACALLTMLSATSSMAANYPWCISEPNQGGSLQCRFTSLGQCQATATGMGGECYESPALLFARQGYPGTGNGPPLDTGRQRGGPHAKRHTY
jgi:Protein of unknown function (DUF3551)